MNWNHKIGIRFGMESEIENDRNVDFLKCNESDVNDTDFWRDQEIVEF